MINNSEILILNSQLKPSANIGFNCKEEFIVKKYVSTLNSPNLFLKNPYQN